MTKFMRHAIHVLTMLLRGDSGFWDRVRSRGRLGPLLAQLLLFVIAASAVYGAAMAGWRSPRLAMFVAIKLPLLLICTTGLVMILNWMFASILKSGLSFLQVVTVTWGARQSIRCVGAEMNLEFVFEEAVFEEVGMLPGVALDRDAWHFPHRDRSCMLLPDLPRFD
jgi:hypothetical protein